MNKLSFPTLSLDAFEDSLSETRSQSVQIRTRLNSDNFHVNNHKLGDKGG